MFITLMIHISTLQILIEVNVVIHLIVFVVYVSLKIEKMAGPRQERLMQMLKP